MPKLSQVKKIINKHLNLHSLMISDSCYHSRTPGALLTFLSIETSNCTDVAKIHTNLVQRHQTVIAVGMGHLNSDIFVRLLPAVLFILLRIFGLSVGTELSSVTCGSVIKLLNVKHNVRLHSHDVRYGSGKLFCSCQ